MTPTDHGDLDEALRRIEQLREQLQSQAQLAALGSLVAGISHEIKNPLNLIDNFAGISDEICLEIEDLLSKRQEELPAVLVQDLQSLLKKLHFNLSRAQEQGKRASAIVERMLRNSRHDDGDFRPADVNALVDDYLTLAYNGIRTVDSGFSIQIDKKFDKNMPVVDISPQSVGQALLNILTNALQALQIKKSQNSSFKGRLQIVTHDRDRDVEISIRDNGVGIKQADLPRIFKPFFTTKQKREGTGLGLSISYDIIVTQHSGDIAVSTRDGKYTEFVISLPKFRDDVTSNKKSSVLYSDKSSK